VIVAAGLSLVYVAMRLSRPPVAALARDPVTGAWDRADRHPDWQEPDGVLVARGDGPLMYPNANAVKERVLALVAMRAPRAVILDLSGSTELDLQTADTLGELADALHRDGSSCSSRRCARLRWRSWSAAAWPSGRVEPTLDAAYDAAGSASR
jgi:MFS superfamily sulfate permease-like transporter